MRNLAQDYMVSAQYYAPRSKEKLMFLGEHISLKHLTSTDKLIGIIGDPGGGKSSFIKGMFPGLQLTNDDDIVNPQKIMQVRNLYDTDIESATTFHIDIRFQMAFTQMYEIADYVNLILSKNRRVVIEHFNLLFPALNGRNADLIVGIGEEIIVTRPSVFGPLPQSIYEMVHVSLKYRKMAHSAEEITLLVLEEELGITDELFYISDIRNGFVFKFPQKPEIDLNDLEESIKKRLSQNISISYYDENNILVGDKIVRCNGSRFHIKNTSEIDNFFLVKEFIYDPKTDTYCLVALIDGFTDDVTNRNTHYFFKRRK